MSKTKLNFIIKQITNKSKLLDTTQYDPTQNAFRHLSHI